MLKTFKTILFIIAIGSSVVLFNETYNERTFVAFVSQTNHQTEFNRNNPLITLKKNHALLKKTFKNNLTAIDENQIDTYLSNGHTILLPWNTDAKQYKALSINNKKYFESEEGAITVKTFSFKKNNYKEFLKNKVIITSGGTVVLSRGVQTVIEKNNDIYFPWKKTKHLFEQSNINIVNLKSPLIKDYEKPTSRWLLYGKKDYIKGLLYANINVVSISGNHMGDAGKEGLLETINLLNNNNIISKYK